MRDSWIRFSEIQPIKFARRGLEELLRYGPATAIRGYRWYVRERRSRRSADPDDTTPIPSFHRTEEPAAALVLERTPARGKG